MKIDWKRKLTSRKLWVAVAALVTNIILACGGTDAVAAQITAIIIGGATVIAYMIREWQKVTKNERLSCNRRVKVAGRH